MNFLSEIKLKKRVNLQVVLNCIRKMSVDAKRFIFSQGFFSLWDIQ